MDPSSISPDVKEYCKKHQNDPINHPECSCINQMDEFKNPLSCAALKVKIRITGKAPTISEGIPDCTADWPALHLKNKSLKQLQKSNNRVNSFRHCEKIYDGIQNALWSKCWIVHRIRAYIC